MALYQALNYGVHNGLKLSSLLEKKSRIYIMEYQQRRKLNKIKKKLN